MLASLKKSWRAFLSYPPGQRFEQRYTERRRKRGEQSHDRAFYIGAGLLLVLTGLFFMLVPGPGLPILLAGVALLAGESLRLARALDRLEQRWRRWAAR